MAFVVVLVAFCLAAVFILGAALERIERRLDELEREEDE